MKSHRLAIGCLAILVVTGRVIGVEPAPKPQIHLLVPAYFYPAGRGLKDWNKLIASASHAPIVAIVNPASGPGEAADPNYVEILKQARRAGVVPIGYITTSYAKRPIAEVKADVDRWVRLYPSIRGIFFDEQASGAEHVDYQAVLYEHARKKRRLDLVITNPGTACSEHYVTRPAADAVCLFEGPRPADRIPLPAWSAHHAPNRIAALAYKVGIADRMRTLIREAVAENVGYLYVTDSGDAMPWGRLARFWDAEVAAVRDLNRKTAK